MPNHVRNVIEMKGIADLPLYSKSDEKGEFFDFNKLIQMPESLDITPDSKMDLAVVYCVTDKLTKTIDELSPEDLEILAALFYPAEKDLERLATIYNRTIDYLSSITEKEKAKLIETGDICVANFKNYKAFSWYNWTWTNWDTKWNAYDFEYVNKDIIKFNTAWSPPCKVIRALSEKYSALLIKHWYADEFEGNGSGYMEYQNGELIKNSEFTFEDEQNAEVYAFCWYE